MKILLLEDDLSLGCALQSVLQDDGHDATWVRLAADGAQRLRSESFDAALFDLSLPDGDGIALLRELRAEGLSLPVLLISARDGLHDRLSGLDSGADDYLIKPFDASELLARLRAVARRARAGASAAAAGTGICRDLVLDERRLELIRAGVSIPLSKTEFALLHALFKGADRVLTRTELERRALPYSEGHTLDVHISNLRKKIGDGYIHTVRGVGYMLQRDCAA